MKLEGSCHCGAVRFSLDSQTPVPFMLCYCTICRKTAGGGGYAINIMGLAEGMSVEGTEHLKIYNARMEGQGASVSPGERHFCGLCASALWVADPRWPEWVYPFASAIDTELPAPPERVFMMENYRPAWAAPGQGPASEKDAHFPEYPEQGIHDWHEARGLLADS